MSGMKKSRTSAKTARDPDSNINKALRRWNCESVEELQNLVLIAEQRITEAKQRLDPKCWSGYKKQGTKMKGGVRVNNCVPKESVEEASSPAQQAAIAIAKKKKEGVKEGLKDPKDNPCWKGYKPVGTKKKNGKTVPNCVPKESVEESIVKEQKIHSKLIKILQQNGFQGPYAVSETPWADQFGDIIFPEDQIMIQGLDVEYDAWVLNPSGDYGYYFGQESGYQSGNAQQVVSWLKTVI